MTKKAQGKEMPKIICVDFDGTIASYKKGYQGKGKYGKVINNTRVLLGKLKKANWYIVIYTTRNEDREISLFLKRNRVPFDSINSHPYQPEESIAQKPYAHIYLDDRAITFDGNMDPEKLFQTIISFLPWEVKNK